MFYGASDFSPLIDLFFSKGFVQFWNRSAARSKTEGLSERIKQRACLPRFSPGSDISGDRKLKRTVPLGPSVDSEAKLTALSQGDKGGMEMNGKVETECEAEVPAAVNGCQNVNSALSAECECAFRRESAGRVSQPMRPAEDDETIAQAQTVIRSAVDLRGLRLHSPRNDEVIGK
ncbi:hypothetical protein GOBAR_AA08720 [Gossypium barbadense]|uniref:Uncharacterized protein n=1 Tax=Gossypium barbadense TaxID=3634 RepID=A0A2P5Y8J0_GOSBA|nr:hypothetical protein GOBAR_AA08720 [Gossypium barbadense]